MQHRIVLGVAIKRAMPIALFCLAQVLTIVLTRTSVHSSQLLNWLGDRATWNSGIALSIPLHGSAAQIMQALVVLVLGVTLVLTYHKQAWAQLRQPLLSITLGAISNLIERIRYGAILDYLPLGPWVSFNIADGMITVGAALLLWEALFTNKSQGVRIKNQDIS